MSTEQSDLGEFDDYNREQTGRGTPIAERAQRPQCGYKDTKDGSPCGYPVVPGRERCIIHMEDNETGQSQSHQIAIATASEDDVEQQNEVRCESCDHPVPAMYRPMCPECGHRNGGA